MAEAIRMPESPAELLARIRLAEDSHLELKQVVFAGAKIKGPRRDDLSDDLAAFANAYEGTLVLGVADRTVEGSRIRLRMYEDRLELYSPGAPPNGMELADLAYRQYSRNGTVTSILARWIPDDIPFIESPRVTFMDRRGEGVNVILRRSEEHSGGLPEYELFGNELRLTIFAANPSE